MRIALIEDSHTYGEELIEKLRRVLADVNVVWFPTESSFLDALPTLQQEPPDLVIADVMIRWESLGRTSKPRPSGTDMYRSGFRCVKALLKHGETRSIPIILHSALDREELESQLSGLPPNVTYVRKGEPIWDVALSMLELSGEVGRPLPRVFLVHGHDMAARESVARFLERLGLATIILDEQPGSGRTIVEQLEEYSDVNFAVVLLTGDDLGRSKDDGSLQARARQNVIFELGYFLARLGRDRVCCLFDTGVEIPTDYSAVIYIVRDAGGAWKTRLAKEIRAAGLAIDVVKVL